MAEIDKLVINLAERPEGNRNFVICIDGTWNDPSMDFDTNVCRLHDALKGGDTEAQTLFYTAGVGSVDRKTHADRRLFRKTGGWFGWGAFGIRNQAYDYLVRNYHRGDRVFIFGFSRGAAVARMLAVMIAERGIPTKIRTKRYDGKWCKVRLGPKQADVDLRFLGIWDTVAAFGLPKPFFGIPFHKINLFRKLHIPDEVTTCVHLPSIDERRVVFTPVLIKTDPTDPLRREETWFTGMHTDVGGGERELAEDDENRSARKVFADVALRYMVQRAKENGLIVPAAFEQDIAGAAPARFDASAVPPVVSPQDLNRRQWDGASSHPQAARQIRCVTLDGRKLSRVRVHRSVLDWIQASANSAEEHAYAPLHLVRAKGFNGPRKLERLMKQVRPAEAPNEAKRRQDHREDRLKLAANLRSASPDNFIGLIREQHEIVEEI